MSKKIRSKSLRPSPSSSATLYKVGTKKTGNDGNIWIVVADKNGIHRWKLNRKKTHKSTTKKTTNKFDNDDKSAVKGIDVLLDRRARGKAIMTLPKIKQKNWDKWLENLTSSGKKIFEKLRDKTSKKLEENNVNIIFIPLPLTDDKYWIDYVWDVAESAYPDMYSEKNPLLIVPLYIDDQKHFDTQHTNNNISIQHLIPDKYINTIIDIFNEDFGKKFNWDGDIDKVIFINL